MAKYFDEDESVEISAEAQAVMPIFRQIIISAPTLNPSMTYEESKKIAEGCMLPGRNYDKIKVVYT